MKAPRPRPVRFPLASLQSEPSRFGRLLRWLAVACLLAALAAIAPLLWLRGQIRDGLIERQLASTLTDVLGRKVTVGSLTMGWTGGLFLDKMGIAGRPGEPPLFLLGQVRVEYSYWELFSGLLVVDSIAFVAPSLHLVREKDGKLNCADMIERLAAMKPPSPGPPPKVRVPERPDDVPRIPLSKITFEKLSVVFEDRMVAPPVVHTMKDFRLKVEMPGPNKPAVLELIGHTGTARVLLKGDFYVAPLVGRAELALDNFTLTGLEPYLAKLPLPLEKPELELSVSGWAELSQNFLTVSEGKPRLDMTALRYGAEVTIPSLRAKLPGGSVGLKLAATVMTGSAKLNILELMLDKTRIMQASGSIDGFTSPSFDFRAKIEDLAVEKALAFVPREKLPAAALDALRRVEPQGVLTAHVRAVGTPAKPLVTGELSARELAYLSPVGTIDFGIERLAFTPDRLDLRGLEVKLLGGKLSLSAIVDDVLKLPAVSFAFDAQSPPVEDLPFPMPVAEAGGQATLRLRGGFRTARLASANHAASLAELAKRRDPAGFEPLKALAAEARLEVERLKKLAAGLKGRSFLVPSQSRRPADHFDWKGLEELRAQADYRRLETLLFAKAPAALRAVRDLLSARLEAELTLEKLRARAGEQLATAGAKVTFDLERGLAIRDARASLGPITAGGELLFEKPLEAPSLRASMALAPGTGTLPLLSLASLAPATAQTRIAALDIDPAARVGLNAAAKLDIGGPAFRVELFADGLAAGKEPMRVSLTPIKVQLSEDGIEVNRFTVTAGPIGLLAEVSARRRDGLKFFLRTADPAGLDLKALAPLLPAESRAKAAQLLAGGRLGADIGAAADLESAGAQLRVRARHPAADLGVALRATELFGAGKIEGLLHVAVPKVSSVVGLLPPTVAQKVEKLDLSRASVDARVTATGDLSKLVLTGSARFPGGETQLVGEVAPLLPPGRAWASLGTRLSRLEEILAILPPEVREKIEKLQPEAQVQLALNVAAEKGRKIVEQTFELSTARAEISTGNVRIPLDASGWRGAVQVTLLDGQKPIIDSDLSGMKLRTVVKNVPIEVKSQGVFRMDTTSARTQDFALLVNGNPIRMDVTVADPFGDMSVRGQMMLDQWQLKDWVDAFVPKQMSVKVTGVASVGARMTGSFPRMDAKAWQELVETLAGKRAGPMPFMQGEAWVELRDIQVDAPQLRGLGAGLPLVRMRILKDDIVIDSLDVVFGVRKFHLPLLGSLKQIMGVPNVYLADPKTVGPRVLSHIGGVERIKNMIGEKQIERIILDQTLKIIVSVGARDYPGQFTFKNVLPPEDKALMVQAPQKVVDKHIELAKQALAEKMGFPKRTYGDKNYRMIQITGFQARVLDEQLNSIYPEFIPFWRLTTTPIEW